MNNLPKMLRKTSLIVGLIIASVLVCKNTGAGEVGMTFPITGTGFSAGSYLSKNDSLGVSPSNSTKLTISLTRSLFLDLSLSSVDTRQTINGADPFSGPPVPVMKPHEFDLRSYRLGVAFDFKF
jgi:hypothetical protein